jgi:uncharacterized protein (TIGR02099 family)
MKRVWIALAGVMITAAIIMTFFRIITPWLNQHKQDVEHQLSLLLGEQVSIKHMETSWYWFQPILKLDEVLVSEQGVPVLQLNKLLVGVNLFSSVLYWQIQPGILLIDDVQLTIRQTEQGWKIDGLRQGNALPSMTPKSYLPVLQWLLLQKKIKVRNVSASVYLRDGTVLPIQSLAIQAVHHLGHYLIKGNVRLGQDSQTELTIQGDISFLSNLLETMEGELFLSAQHVQFSPWKILFEQYPYHIEKGEGGFNVWLKYQNGHLSQVQSAVKLQDIEWNNRAADTPPHQLEHLTANIAWRPTSTGWQWSADHVFLNTTNKTWPENGFILEYQIPSKEYRLYIKRLFIEPTLLTLFDWPSAARSILELQPTGQFDNSQIGFSDGDISYFLSRFSDLSWEAKDNIPAVKHISGAFYWQPSEGRLELDGENTILTLNHQKPLEFHTVSMALDWKALNDAWRISLDRLLLEHAHLLLSARGVLDGYSAQSSGNIQATAEFSSKKAHFWLPYLPQDKLKPKLAAWLKQDIKRIAQANGHIVLNGAVADFPFDNKPGNFTVATSLDGVDLFFNHDWPMLHQLNAYLTVNKRELNADISDGYLYSGLPIKKLNVHMSELGLGQETLLVHGNINAPANQMLSYIFVSPLQKQLKKLNVLSIQNNLDLDLALAVPLYPETDDVSVQGSVLFNDNDATVNLALQPLYLQHMLGTLFFDEHGVSDSALQATFLEEPIHLDISTLHGKKAATQIKLAGDFSLSLLRKQWSMPLLSLMQGRASITGLITLAKDSKAWDNIQLMTSLQGVQIALPAPLGKQRETLAPLEINAEFNFAKGIHLQTHYEDRLNSDVWFYGKDKFFKPSRGLICVQCKQAKSSDAAGLILDGKLDTLDWGVWQVALNKLHNTQTSTQGFQAFRAIHLTLGVTTLLGQNLKNLTIDATQMLKNVWSVAIKQKASVLADLSYQMASNTLSGQITHLDFTKSADESLQTHDEPVTLNPGQIPNLSITVDSLRFNQMDLGKLIINGTTHSNLWHLDEARLESFPYTLSVAGTWFKQDMTDKTDIEATLKVHQLAQLLEIWGIPPVVEAQEGTMQLKGGWGGDFRAFSLKRIAGNLYIIFKNGRITHLDPATEEKLGLGKLLSILSLQTIPRRLKLDFSDLANNGYSFDQFEGRFVLKEGVMSTDNSTIDGPVAYASIKGNLDLDKRFYDLDLHVTPHITASLPVVATIAGGPIAGIATWAASKMLNPGVDKVTGYTYSITGPWLEPVVQQVHIYRNKAA